MTEPKASTLRSFPQVFWIANVMELFERGAYYGMNAVLAVYLTNPTNKAGIEGGLGFTEQSVGFLQGIVYALTYILPILGGALADRYGFRRLLLVAFSFLATGYFLTGYQSTYGLVFLGLLIMATGSGLFKPIITGVIARTTTEANSGIGFGIYYWMINLGAFLAPLLVSYLKGFSWQYVFMASSLYCGLMLIPTVFFFRDPPGSKSQKTIQQVLSGMAMVLGDARFMLMIIVYSGFWILYFQNFNTVLWFLRDFVNTKPIDSFFAQIGFPNFKFDSEHVTIINAGIIILLQVVVSAIVKDRKPLPTMITGFIFGILGFVCLAFTTNIWLFITGIVVFTLGEMTAHPKYYSYIGLVAPSDKKTVYMGYAFLYGIVGSLVGTNLGGVLYEKMMKPLIGRPNVTEEIQKFWFIFVGLGVMAALGLILYNKFLSEDTPKTNFIARQIIWLVYGILMLVGGYFLYISVSGEEILYKTMVQAGIMIVLGLGGILITSSQKR